MTEFMKHYRFAHKFIVNIQYMIVCILDSRRLCFGWISVG